MGSPLRVVVTSDNHLGRYYDRLGARQLETRRAWLRQGWEMAVACALERGAHLFLQGGDLFDTPDPRNVERVAVAEALARLHAAGVACYAIGGNHDTPRQRTDHGGATPQSVYAELGRLELLSARGAIATRVRAIDGRRVAIGGLSWDPALPPGADPLAGQSWNVDADLRLLLLHHGVEGQIYPGANEPILRHATLADFPADVFLVGHVHHHAHLQLDRRLVVVPGATERMTFGESRETPGFVYLELAPGGVERLEHHPVPSQPRREATVRVETLDGDDLAAALLRQIEPVCHADALVRVKLVGTIPREAYHALDLAGARDFGAARSAYFDLHTEGLSLAEELPLAVDSVRLAPRDELECCADELLAAATDPAERELLLATRAAVLAAYDGYE
ncbi:MAG TPA: metallophosphoesterase [Chloroflexota bacterium]|nr:metallophosphoesterase [Chloroflexota bacterium]